MFPNIILMATACRSRRNVRRGFGYRISCQRAMKMAASIRGALSLCAPLLHVKQHVTQMRRRDGLCPCGQEPRVNGQGYGPLCHAKRQKAYRDRKKQENETNKYLADLYRYQQRLTP